ncbi:MAG: hypothetical protein IKT16_02425, partial [Desulfovibrio sp.]|nr:hypothetical protein [Desulfovibrio sp.]
DELEKIRRQGYAEVLLHKGTEYYIASGCPRVNGGLPVAAGISIPRARYDRELCQACRGGGFARRMVAGPEGQSPPRLHAYLGREDMMPASTVGGTPVSQGIVHFTLCRPRQL